MPQVLTAIGYGGNLGNREANCRKAIDLLSSSPHLTIIRQSAWYETKPVGWHDQPSFLNGALAIETPLSPRTLLHTLQHIERRLGRTRDLPNGPRTIDLDLLLYDNLILDEPDLTVPHPRLIDRAFVLVPLGEILPDIIHPLCKRPISLLLKNLGCVEHLIKPYENGRTDATDVAKRNP